MQKLSDYQTLVVRLAVKQYYGVIPSKFKTFCVFNARVLVKTFAHFGIHAQVVPCQAMLSTPETSLLLGFIGSNPGEGGWDGHAVCRVGNYLIDVSLDHFSGALKENSVDYAIVEEFKIDSNVLGRFNVSQTTRIWWVNPPAGVDSSPPSDNPDTINKYSSDLIAHMENLLKPSKKELLLNTLQRHLEKARSILSNSNFSFARCDCGRIN